MGNEVSFGMHLGNSIYIVLIREQENGIMVLPTQQEHKLFAEGRGTKCHHTYPTARSYAKPWVFILPRLQRIMVTFMLISHLLLPSWISLCWRVVSWVSCMSHRRTCPQTRSKWGKSNLTSCLQEALVLPDYPQPWRPCKNWSNELCNPAWFNLEMKERH